MTLKIRMKQTRPGTVTCSPSGTLDSDTAPLLDREITRLLAEPIKTLVLDMAGVEFISSAGLGTVAKTKTALNRQGADLALINLRPQIRKVFEIIRLLPTFNVFESMQELDDYLEKIQKNFEEESG
jgi:anti-anti-sigma factor